MPKRATARFSRLLFLVPLLTLQDSALAKSKVRDRCPETVNAVIDLHYAGSAVKSCSEKKTDDGEFSGPMRYVTLLKTKEARWVEIESAANGDILLTKVKLKVESVPDRIIRVFQAKHPKARITAAETRIDASGEVGFGLAFRENGRNHEMILKKDGTISEAD
jgi:hypothetical protein